MAEFSLQFEIHFLTGFQIQSGYGHQHLNQVVVRDVEGELVIPASSLKGRMRYYTELFHSILSPQDTTGDGKNTPSEIINHLFGSSGDKKGSVYFDAGRLKEEFRASADSSTLSGQKRRFRYREERTGTQILRTLGSVRGKHLRFYEATPRGLQFSSEIEGALENPDQLFYLLGAMRLFNQLGADKSRGNGSVSLIPIQLFLTLDGESPQQFNESEMRKQLEHYVQQKLGE